jgi:hypothetical protein
LSIHELDFNPGRRRSQLGFAAGWNEEHWCIARAIAIVTHNLQQAKNPREKDMQNYIAGAFS